MKRHLVCILAYCSFWRAAEAKVLKDGTPAPPSTTSSHIPGGMSIEDIAVSLVSDMAAGKFDQAVSIIHTHRK